MARGAGLRRWRRPVGWITSAWRGSIQVRVVASTVLLTLVVVSVVGWLLVQQTRDGLLAQRLDTVTAEAASETLDAERRLEAAPGTESDAASQRQDLIEPIIRRGAARGFWVVLAPSSEGSRVSDGGATYTQGLDIRSVPEDLQAHFSGFTPGSAWTYTTITRTLPSGGTGSVPGIAVGSQVRIPADGSLYTIYYLYPLDEEQETLALVTRALLTAGVLLLALVAGVAWLVSRQVVTPVRMARRVAERLAAGELQERVQVRGEDDLARLAVSFNQMATNLQGQIRQLEELSRVQRRFVSDVSHELRTPLTTVRMASDMLHDAREEFDTSTRRAAELLASELDRFETLLSDLLEISRFDAGAVQLDLTDVDLTDLAHEVAERTRPLAGQRRTRVVVHAATGPVLAEADVRRVERVVRNLVTNAIDHTEDGDVEVTVAGDEHSAAVVVRDHGVGLRAGEEAMVFNRFWRSDPARARTSGGTGLGLAISLEDARLHGGWLQAWGRPGQGAQFRLTLPRRAGSGLRRSPLPLVPADVEEPA